VHRPIESAVEEDRVPAGVPGHAAIPQQVDRSQDVVASTAGENVGAALTELAPFAVRSSPKDL
jgi:hypothetical protein